MARTKRRKEFSVGARSFLKADAARRSKPISARRHGLTTEIGTCAKHNHRIMV